MEEQHNAVTETQNRAEPAPAGDDYLGFDEIRSADDTVFSVVPTPEWNGKVRVRSLRSTERDGYEDSLVRGKGRKATVDMKQSRAKLAARGIVNAAGDRVFDYTDQNHIRLLGSKNSAALERVCREIRRISGMRDDEGEDGDSGNETATD